MADTQPQNDERDARLASTIATAVTAGIAASQKHKITSDEYDPKSPFHPDRRKAKRLTRECMQNGVQCFDSELFDEEIELLNQITTPGFYIQGLVEVALLDNGNGPKKVDIRWANRTQDQRYELRNYVSARGRKSVFHDILAQIVEAQDEQAAQAPVVPSRRK